VSRRIRFADLAAALLLAAPPVLAQSGCGADGQIQTRADLLARLGTHAVIEGFEGYSIAPGFAELVHLACIDNSSIAQGQGPGLVQPGASYCDPGGISIAWNGDQYYQLTTKTIESDSASTLRITYTQPVTAMGVDLLAFFTFPYSGTATIYDTANQVVGTVQFTLTIGGSERVFVGWAHAAGIGRVDIFSSGYTWSPVIDDHVYGNCGPALLTPFCFGDGLDPLVTTQCPCSHFGAAGHGCANAADAQGAQLSATGTTSPDTVQLTSAGEPGSSLSIFLQGTTAIGSGVLFGDGVRCTSGALRRLYVHNASGGSVSAPVGADVPITTRSAQLGDTILPGTPRFYQTYYRDPSLGFCTGLGFNVSGGLRIDW
jgi:hypothetical protein